MHKEIAVHFKRWIFNQFSSNFHDDEKESGTFWKPLSDQSKLHSLFFQSGKCNEFLLKFVSAFFSDKVIFRKSFMLFLNRYHRILLIQTSAIAHKCYIFRNLYGLCVKSYFSIYIPKLSWKYIITKICQNYVEEWKDRNQWGLSSVLRFGSDQLGLVHIDWIESQSQLSRSQ